MTPGVARGVSDEQSLEKQMGCMAGFLQLFDRHQVIAGKRLYAAKRLPTSSAAGSTSPSERSDASFASSFMKETQPSPSPEACPSSPESRPARPSLPLPVFEFKDGMRSSWKLRECPRLSLDSRAVVDAKGKLRPREIRTTPAALSGSQRDASEAGEDLDKQRRSPSVVARLMGLDALPDAGAGHGDPVNRAELRRSSSESRVPRDPYRFVDSSAFKNPPPSRASVSAEVFRLRATESRAESGIRHCKPDPPRAPMAASLQRKSFFDSQDFFPEPKRTGSLYYEIERRLRMRGIDEPAKDLETLKQILEVVQLKGLLHSKLPPEHQANARRSNLVFDHQRARISGDPPIVVMKPAPRPPRRAGSEPPILPSRSVAQERARRDREGMDRNPRCRSPRSPDRTEVSRNPISPARRRPFNSAEPLKGAHAPQRRTPSVHSPRTSPKRLGSDPTSARSPRNRSSVRDDCFQSPPVEDDTSTISESSISISSQFDFERSRVEYRAGRSLLERCDKLLDSIAAITSSAAEQVTAVDQQPSPVSVLDSSSLLCDDTSSPSGASKRAIDFKDQHAEWGEELWSPGTPTVRSRYGDGAEAEVEEDDFVYVSEILRATDRARDPSGVYAMLEKRHQAAGGAAASQASLLHRRLVFDTVGEILDRKRHVSAWDAFSSRAASGPSAGGAELLRQVWAEVQRMREQVLPAAADLNDVTRGAIRKDIAAGDRGWGGAPVEMSDAVLHIERQIFKDLVAETIRDLADVAGTCRPPLRQRKLVF